MTSYSPFSVKVPDVTRYMTGIVSSLALPAPADPVLGMKAPLWLEEHTKASLTGWTKPRAFSAKALEAYETVLVSQQQQVLCGCPSYR